MVRHGVLRHDGVAIGALPPLRVQSVAAAHAQSTSSELLRRQLEARALQVRDFELALTPGVLSQLT